MKKTYRRLSGKTVYKTPWFKVLEDQVIKPSGKRGIYSFVELPSAVAVIALDQKSQVYLLKQYRYPIKKWAIELPYGSVDVGETTLTGAKRELQEETGLVAKKWQGLGSFYPHRGICKELDFVYLATDLTDTGQHNQQEEGISEVFSLPLKTAIRWVKDGKINDGQCIAALMLADLYLKS